MLVELHLENLGVIEHLDVVFGPGLCAVTGETGAGKTLIVEAIELLVGGRADTVMVRSGATQARVDGRFELADGTEVVLSRVIPATGRSRAYVDGRPSTVAAMAEICAPLVDLHGQHAHQSLLERTVQRRSLDIFAGIDTGELNAARASVAALRSMLSGADADERERAREIDLLRYQIAELQAAGLERHDEDELLARREEVLADATAYRLAGEVLVDAITGDGGARDRLAAGYAALDGRDPYREIVRRIDGLLAELDDIAAGVRHIADAIEDDPAALEEIRLRRQLLADLRRKYGADLAEVLAYLDRAIDRLGVLEAFESDTADARAELERAEEHLSAVEARIGRQRRDAAPEFARRIEGEVRQLALAGARLAFEFPASGEDPAGDQVELRFSAHRSGEMLPVSKVASGGELARVMLAVRRVLCDAEAAPEISTLVFDEVDAGIGGTAAVAVAEALAALGDRYQVMVVTHLAQVAALATRHIVVTKFDGSEDGSDDGSEDGSEGDHGAAPESGRPQVVAVAVDGAERLGELARMLSGTESEAARRHAAELLESAGSTRSAARPR